MQPSVHSICLDTAHRSLCVAILHAPRALDASTYQDFLAQSHALHETGTRRLVLDLRNVHAIGTAGLFAVHSIVFLYAGAEPPAPESGWHGLKAVAVTMRTGPTDVKIAAPQPHVAQLLKQAGLSPYESVSSALAAFQEFSSR